MKKILLSFCLMFLLVATLDAGHFLQKFTSDGGTFDPCSGGSEADPGDIICESFEGANDPQGGFTHDEWVIEDGGGDCAITLNQAHVGDGDFSCESRGIDYIEIDQDGSAAECGISNTKPNFEDPSWYSFSVKVVSHSMAPSERFFIIVEQISNWGVIARNDGGTLKWQVFHHDKDDNIELDFGPNITLGTWYRHRLYIDANCGTEGVGDEDCIQWWVAVDDGVYSEQTISDDSVSVDATQTIVKYGDVDLVPNGAYHILLDNIFVDETGFGDTCNE